MRVVFISVGPPDPRAGGGPSRSHQLLCELQSFFGEGNVTQLCSGDFLPEARDATSLVNRAFRRWKRITTNPFQLVSRENFGVAHVPSAALHRYRLELRKQPEPGLCVLESPILTPLKRVNDEMGFRTVVAPWSYESLTHNLLPMTSAFAKIKGHEASRLDRLDVRAVLTSFANDLIFSAEAERTWALSIVESQFLEACGIASGYLPYYPVGESEDGLRAVRRQRRPEAGLFVICGGGNDQNLLGLQALLRHLRKEDIPAGARIVIVGLQVLPKALTVHLEEKIEFRGRLPEGEFSDLLAKAHAVLIPQTCGFGCITRVADMLCAGIPVVAGAILANGIGQVPGVRFVADTPGAWASALSAEMAQAPTVYPEAEYQAWQQAQRLTVLGEFARVAARYPSVDP